MIDYRKNKWKVLNLIMFCAGILTYFISNTYWDMVCVKGDCVPGFIDAFLSPVRFFGVVIAVIFSIFIFLPQEYFKCYLTHWFWWIFLLLLPVVLATKPVGGSVVGFDRDFTVLILGGLGLLQAIIFIVIHYFKKRKSVS